MWTVLKMACVGFTLRYSCIQTSSDPDQGARGRTQSNPATTPSLFTTCKGRKRLLRHSYTYSTYKTLSQHVHCLPTSDVKIFQPAANNPLKNTTSDTKQSFVILVQTPSVEISSQIPTCPAETTNWNSPEKLQPSFHGRRQTIPPISQKPQQAQRGPVELLKIESNKMSNTNNWSEEEDCDTAFATSSVTVRNNFFRS